MMEKIVAKIGSRKLLVAIIGFVAVIVNSAVGKPVDDDSMTKALGFLGAYVIAQGISDHGAQGKKADIVIAAGEDEGPNWEDTTDVDDDPDEKRELLG